MIITLYAGCNNKQYVRHLTNKFLSALLVLSKILPTTSVYKIMELYKYVIRPKISSVFPLLFCSMLIVKGEGKICVLPPSTHNSYLEKFFANFTNTRKIYLQKKIK